MNVDHLVADLANRLYAGFERRELDVLKRRTRIILVLRPADPLATYAAGALPGFDRAQARFARRLEQMATLASLGSAARLRTAGGDRSRASRCWRRCAVLAPASREAWHALSQEPHSYLSTTSIYRAGILSRPSEQEGLRALQAAIAIITRSTAGNRHRDSTLHRLVVWVGRCLDPSVAGLRTRVTAVVSAVGAIGSHFRNEPELCNALARPNAPHPLTDIFDLARIGVLLAPSKGRTMEALIGANWGWGWSGLGPEREAMTIDATFRRFLVDPEAGAQPNNETNTFSKKNHLKRLRTLIALEQRNNTTSPNLRNYYSILINSHPKIIISRNDSANRIARPSSRQIGLYVGSLDSITARCFAPGVVSGLSKNGFDCVVYTRSSPSELEAAPLFRSVSGSTVRFSSLFERSATEAATIVARDENAMYVDLRGHSTDSFVQLLVAKPSPRVAYMIGSGETSGIPQVDFLVSDRILAPKDREYRAERSNLTLEQGLLHFSPGVLPEPIQALPDSDSSRIRFGAFHQFAKVTRLSVRLWASALRATPNSVLSVKFNTRQSPDFGPILIKAFIEEGIDEDRIDLMDRAESVYDHFNAVRNIDVMLDSTPFNGETTTFETLWLGVPVVSVLGERMIARYGASILHHSGLGWLCAQRYEDFGPLAAKVAHAVSWRRDFRRDGREMLKQAPAFNLELYGQSVAEAFDRALTSVA